MTPRSTSRVDLHCHSTASAVSKLGVQRALGLPECATPPEEVYELAKRRGMDFVTITDHDTIDGALELAARHDDAFVSEELTAWFRGEPQAVHILCWGITPDDHQRLRALSGDVEAVAAELRARSIACALAHPFYAVEAPLLPRHRRRLAQLFGIWETRNGSRARELNAPAVVYIETHGGIGVGGSDDHAGVDVGRTFTETPPAETWRRFLDHVVLGHATARGEQGSAAKWTHAAMGLATRALGRGASDGPPPDPQAVFAMVQRLMREGDARGGAIGSGLVPDDARALLRAWMASVELDLSEPELLAHLQDEDFSHADLFRRARRCHERKLATAIDEIATMAPGGADVAAVATTLFDACLAAIPYAPAAAFLGREKAKLATRDGEPLRVALVADAVGGMHGVTHTLDELRERGVPGFEVEVVGTDASVDRRLSAVAEVDIPFYAGLKVGVPSLPAIVEALADGRYDLVHLCSPGPSGAAAGIIARVMGLPVLGSYHTELAAYAGLRSRDPNLEIAARIAVGAFYGQCRRVLSPSPASDDVLRAMGIAGDRVGRWDRGVDIGRFSPERRVEGLLPGAITVLYAGRLTREKGADLLADAFLAAHERDPRLQLVLAGGGPEEDVLRQRLGEHATFLGWLEGDALARAYASADLFLFASRTDTFGQVLLEAQASGLAVVAVGEGGPTSIVSDGATGRLCPADAGDLAAVVCELAAQPLQRERLARSALESVRERTWERSLQQLADGYRRALQPAEAGIEAERAVA
ncbi:MAG TPA: glycosyltransferase [Solirubrobacteraceae bacterium]|jgi:glycosyltransferase involved in cell wall biosynthesis/predicted metal-dependent phosphoesterase TrpH|nr:glycosyltransferase [Solirubrobacteraceae bacterium]